MRLEAKTSSPCLIRFVVQTHVAPCSFQQGKKFVEDSDSEDVEEVEPPTKKPSSGKPRGRPPAKMKPDTSIKPSPQLLKVPQGKRTRLGTPPRENINADTSTGIGNISLESLTPELLRSLADKKEKEETEGKGVLPDICLCICKLKALSTDWHSPLPACTGKFSELQIKVVELEKELATAKGREFGDICKQIHDCQVHYRPLLSLSLQRPSRPSKSRMLVSAVELFFCCIHA